MPAWMEGGEQLKRQLRAMGAALAGPVLTEAAQAGADLVAERAEALAPVDDGDLKRSIGTKVRETRVPFRGSVSIGYNPQIAPYGKWQELGTSKMAAQPFLRPAIRRERRATVAAIGVRLREAIVRAIR